MRRLGIAIAAPTHLIVSHLIRSADAGIKVNKQVWVALNENVPDPSLSRLQHRACILVGDDPHYWNPDHVFWDGPAFGGRRVVLGKELAAVEQFLNAVGVRTTATTDDAIDVLHEIAELYDTSDDQALANHRQGVYEAWALISAELSEETKDIVAELADERVAVDRLDALEAPARLYIEDRPGLPKEFPVEVQRRVIDFDPDIAPGLRVAGVLDFSQAVSVVMLEDGDPRPAGELDDRLTERWPGLHRVAEGLGGPDATTLGLRATFKRQEVTSMRVQYELAHEPDAPASGHLHPLAIFEPQSRTLYVDRTDGYPWTQLSRELAVAICGQRAASRRVRLS